VPPEAVKEVIFGSKISTGTQEQVEQALQARAPHVLRKRVTFVPRWPAGRGLLGRPTTEVVNGSDLKLGLPPTADSEADARDRPFVAVLCPMHLLAAASRASSTRAVHGRLARGARSHRARPVEPLQGGVFSASGM
jgi:hypothetical protein